jgi:glutamate N-acetyltransferase / amino-acid N-acetyltransferase
MSNSLNRVGVCFPDGFEAAGVAAGIKKSGKLDLALVLSKFPANAAAVFTANKVKSASILVSQEHLNQMAKSFRAVLISSGNANAATGQEGIKVCKEMCQAVSEQLGFSAEEVLIGQTGLIGIPLNCDIAVKGSILATKELSEKSGENAAVAMMTTDTKMKVSTVEINIKDKAVRIGAMAKGAAMLAPSMATMLAVITTDANISRPLLADALNEAMEDSFHSMSVDGCQSTNDTVFLLANAASGSESIMAKDESYQKFLAALKTICIDLAMQMASDAEGSTKFLRMEVIGAKNKADAKLAAMSVVKSTLVKCSLAGELAYWGRVIAELGASGADFNPNDVEISYGGFMLCKNGMSCSVDQNSVDHYMKQKNIHILARIGNGSGNAVAFGCDLTHAYVDENMSKS